MTDLTEQDRQLFHKEVESTNVDKTGKKSSVFSIAKVFAYMGIGLLITALVAFGVGAAVYYNFNFSETGSEEIANTYFIILIASAIALFIDMIVINLVVVRNKHSVLIPGIISAVLVGVLFSMLTIAVDWRLLGMAFGVTVLAFFLMGLIAFLSKGSLQPLLIVIIGLTIGIALMVLVNWLFALITGTIMNGLYIGISIAILALLMFVTIYDMWRIKKIAESGAFSHNLSLYCAFIMYTDFINVFIRILYFLLIIFGKKK